MSKELIVSVTPQETKAAILENDQVIEIHIERDKEHGVVGAICKGRVMKVLPGMQSAFVDIGLERDAFLYVSDFFEDADEYDKLVSTAEEQVEKLGQPASAAVSLVAADWLQYPMARLFPWAAINFRIAVVDHDDHAAFASKANTTKGPRPILQPLRLWPRRPQHPQKWSGSQSERWE